MVLKIDVGMTFLSNLAGIAQTCRNRMLESVLIIY